MRFVTRSWFIPFILSLGASILLVVSCVWVNVFSHSVTKGVFFKLLYSIYTDIDIMW